MESARKRRPVAPVVDMVDEPAFFPKKQKPGKKHARFRRVSVEIWNETRWRRLGDFSKLIFFFINSHPNLTRIGAMRATREGLSAEIGWQKKKFFRAFTELEAADFIRSDSEASFLQVADFLMVNQPENPNVVKSWAAILRHLPQCSLRDGLFVELRETAFAKGEAFAEVFAKAFMEDATKPLPKEP